MFFTIGYVVFGISLGVIQVNPISIISDFYKLNKSKMLLRIFTGFTLGNFAVPGIVSIVLFINVSWKYIFLSIALLNSLSAPFWLKTLYFLSPKYSIYLSFLFLFFPVVLNPRFDNFF